ncbi:VOC family protein [Fimbriiglobus ruber]|uniref:VOC family protein n=1 Tax=Fimbriiglobus ruber TaxID=1908690 RepID=UPI00137B57A6|nr:VOC family protein [Fimbriiglobus ruber]
MIQGLRTVIYHVSDLNRAKAWYAQVVGREPYFDEPYYVGFDVGGFELGLVPDGKSGPGGTVAYWGVPDAAAEWDRLLALGATPREPVQDVGGGIKVATVADPFGNSFGVIENPHFSVEKVRQSVVDVGPRLMPVTARGPRGVRRPPGPGP